MAILTNSKPFDDDDRQESDTSSIRDPDQEDRILEVPDIPNTETDELGNEERQGHYRDNPSTSHPYVLCEVCCYTYTSEYLNR